MYKMKLYSLVSYATICVLTLMYLNFLSVCLFTITCSSYIPTFSYLASFRAHDTGAVLALCIFAFTLVLVFFSWHLKVHKLLTIEEFVFMILLELIIFSLCLCVGLIDEVNGIEFNPVENLHQFLTFSLCIFVSI